MRSGPRFHYWRPEKRRICDEAWKLDAGYWQSRGWLKAECDDAIAFNQEERPLRIDYALRDDGIEVRHWPIGIRYTVPLAGVGSAAIGGTVLYWLCPIATASGPCRRRCRVLYLPFGEGVFGCRQCHNLTYRSSQESGKGDALIARVGGIVGSSGVARMLKGWV